jgi:hypothetical protein
LKTGEIGSESTTYSDLLIPKAQAAVEPSMARPTGQAKTRRKPGRFRAFSANIFEKYY